MKFFSLFFLGVLVIFFYEVFFQNQVLYCCDNLLINLPSRAFLHTELLSGRFPFWNPQLFSGIPFLADINLSPVYPGIFLEVLFSSFISPFTIITLSAIFHIFWAGMGMYWCSSRMGMKPSGRLTSAFLFSLSGTLLTYTGNIPMLQVASWFPWVLSAVVQLGKTPSYRNLGLTALLGALQSIAGHPQLTYLSWLVYGAYFLVFQQKNAVRSIFTLTRLGLLVLLVGSIQLLPFIEFALHSGRMGRGWEYATYGSLPLWGVLRLVLPSIVGDLRLGTDWVGGGSVYGYVGVLALFLAVLGVNKRRERLFWVGLGSIGLLSAFGSLSPVFWTLYTVVPGVSLFRVPSHFLFFCTVSTAMLAGWGIHSLPATNKRLTRLGLVVLFLGVLFWFFSSRISEEITQLDFPSKVESKLQFIGESGLLILVRDLAFNIGFVGLCLGVLFSGVRYKKQIVLLLLIIDLFLYSKRAFLTMPGQWVQELVGKTRTLGDTLAKNNQYRYFVHESLYPSHLKKQFGIPEYPKEVLWQSRMFRPNFTMFSDLLIIDGYGAVTLRKYQEFFGTKSVDPTGVAVGAMSSPVLDELGVQYIVIPANSSLWSRDIEEAVKETKRFVIVKQYDDFFLVENLQAKPRLRVEFSDKSFQAVDILQENPGFIHGRITTSTEATVVFSENSYPGWNATIDGKEWKHNIDSGILQTVNILPGSHDIVFSFVPRSVQIGVIGTFIGVCICVSMISIRPSKSVLLSKKRFT